MFVRSARVEDAAGIGSVHVRAWQAGYRGIAPDAYLDQLSVGERVLMWEAQLSAPSPDTVLFVAEDNSSVVGFGGGGPATRPSEPRVFELFELNVDPGHWGMGAGGALLDAFTAWSRERGAFELVLWVAVGNARARAFYEHRGMLPDGVVEDRDVLGMHVRELRYRKALAP
jgi:ribosomal protein S18 acetylase RimI-like enzyme